jgi:hypothetical protein
VVSSWTFRQLLEDVIAQHPDDSELHTELKAASVTKTILLDGFHPDFSQRLADAIRETAAAISSGEVQTSLTRKPYGTDGLVTEYRHALEKLVAVVGALPDFAP